VDTELAAWARVLGERPWNLELITGPGMIAVQMYFRATPRSRDHHTWWDDGSGYLLAPLPRERTLSSGAAQRAPRGTRGQAVDRLGYAVEEAEGMYEGTHGELVWRDLDGENAHAEVARLAGQARWRRRLAVPGYDFAGLVGAVVFFCLSLTPSLLPRSWLFQAVAGGIVAAIGYGLGVLVGWLVRRLTGWVPGARTRRIGWWALGVGAAALLVVFLELGLGWQREIHRLMGEPPPARYQIPQLLLGAVLLFAALVGSARLLRGFARLLGRVFGRRMPLRVAFPAGAVVAVLLVWGLLEGVVYRGALEAADDSFRVINRETSAGVAAPSSRPRSGGPGSLVSWASLGRMGRDFVGGATTTAELQAFSRRPSVEPIRVYAGVDSASDARQRAALVVKELQRTGAFSRRVLGVITATGTGWVDEGAVDPLEYMYNGDTALAAMQYSYLPSWISFLVDRHKATQAGRSCSTRSMRLGRGCPSGGGRGCWSSARAWGRSAARQRSAGPTTSATGPTGCCGSARPTATPSGDSSPADVTTARPRSCRPTSRAPPSGSPANPPTCAARQRRGPPRGWSTCSTPPIRSPGGRRGCCCASRTGCGNPRARTCCRRCAGIPSSPSGRSPPTWSSLPKSPPATGTPTGANRLPPGPRSHHHRAGPLGGPPSSSSSSATDRNQPVQETAPPGAVPPRPDRPRRAAIGGTRGGHWSTLRDGTAG